ncbi:MAG TPA: Fe-S cluster assembly protein SufD, partial [Rhodobacterales bacterium]|nr:Fe-S cluster assembly protein SufD [Rhodobacterales bacterium]
MAALAQAKGDALAAREAALVRPDGGKWISEARNEAAARLAAMGLPGPRDEYWRFTKPASLNTPAPAGAAVFDTGDEAPVFGAVDRLKIVFVDGVFSPDDSDPLEAAGVEIERLAEAGSKDIHWARDVFGVLEARGQTPVARPFAALNTAYASDGVVIRVTGKAARPISLIYRHENEASDALLHHVVKLEPGADLTLLENGPAAARLNKVLEVEVGDGAAFHHVRPQGRDHERQAITHVFARLGTASTFKSFTLTVNGRLTRNECVVEMLGDNAVAHIAGAAMGDGGQDPFHHDDTVFVTHDGLDCESRPVFKKVLRNGAVGACQG